ncbi:endonuclease/exonuclease/phosphatase family protein [Oerskovia paurometabola]|uniref:Endonuclease/exonuclease/phosphatase family protein n=1 Tax=Oerskovia paurometabola TaxID=162170 RepID=A0ABW1X9M8_9CELL|nr:endonuclease/exonuclease/phosphatase family protein [Oerskovia paurometabola]MBM7498032.1 endonuclease/exonuclease/phosphatase family metal-dependent hydrolase/NADH:ubiquinone oxidoreductase subunit K [Oerskovia paurometabola]
MTDEHRTSSHDPGDGRAPTGPLPPGPDPAPALPMTRAERRAAEQAALERQAGTSWRSPTPTGALPTARPATAALPTTTGATAWERVEVSAEPSPPPSAWRERAARFAPTLAPAPAPGTDVPAVQAAPAGPDAPSPRRSVGASREVEDPSEGASSHTQPTLTLTGPPPSTEGSVPTAAVSSSTPFPTRRQISHAARHVTRLGRGNAARLLLLTVVTAIAVEMIRASGPLLDRAFASGVTIAAGTALITYAAPALAVTIIAARLPISGRVTLGAVLALVGWRLGLQGLGVAAGADGVLGSARYGLGLGGTALAVATLVIVAAFVSGVRPVPADDSPERVAGAWTPLANGRMVALGVSLGVLGAAGVSLLHGTWDAYWRTGPLSWVAPLALGGMAVVSAWLLRRDTAAPGARGFWVLGPYLALGVLVFGNPAFIASQTGLPLSVAAGAVATMALMVGLTTVRGTARSSRPGGNALLSALGRCADLVALLAFALVVFALPGRTEVLDGLLSWALLVCIVGLAVAATDAVVHALTRPAQDIGWLRLAGASTAVGLGLILPLLVYQLDYDVPLPVPNAVVPVLVALAIGAAGLRRTRLLPQAAAGTAAAARVAPPSVRVALPVVAAVAVLAAGGAAVQLVDLPTGTSGSPAAGAEPGLVVLDWNLHYGVSATPSVELDDVAATIRDSGAQVVTLQEVSRGWVLGGGVDMASYLARATDMEVAFVGAADRQFGNAILWDPAAVTVADVSRLALPFGAGPQHRSAISATVAPRAGTETAWAGGVRVTSVHLQHREQSTPTRLDQLDALFAAEPVDGTYLLAGDFNAEPDWEEITLVESQGLVSGQDTAGNPDDLTSPADAPRHRIDWMFGSGMTFERFRVLDDVSSDHRPLVTVVRPGQEPEPAPAG